MSTAIIALLAGSLLFLAGCRSGGSGISQQMLNELSRKNAELVTLTTVAGTLSTALVVFAACLAFALYKRRKETGNGRRKD